MKLVQLRRLIEKSEIRKKQGNKWRETLRDQRHTSDTDSDSDVEVRSKSEWRV